jgi:hypothetical protein
MTAASHLRTRGWHRLMVAVVLALTGAAAIAQNPIRPGASGGKLDPAILRETPTTAGAPSGSAKPAERLHEGTRLIDDVGTFQDVGDRVVFLPGGNKDSYRVLENLALERISRTLDENRRPRQWVVSGVITEFRGANYLLVTKASIQLQEGDSAAGP